MAATPASTFKPLSMMADSFSLFSSPSMFAKPPPPPHKCLSISLKQPIKLYFSSHSSSPLSLKPNSRLSFPKIPFVAQTSDWAPQQAQELEGEEQSKWENEESEDPEARVSDFDVSQGEDASVEAVGESGQDGDFGEEDFVEPPEGAKLYVGNLPYDVDSEQLAMLFSEAGTVEISEVIYNRVTDTSRGFGFVTMSTVEEADKAVEMFHRYDLDGRLLAVNKAAPRGTRIERTPRESGPVYRAYVGNLPWDVDDSRLEQVFSEHGNVVSTRVVFDRETGRSRGFGFVTMSTETELNDAITALNGENLDGREIRVSVAEERRKPSF